MPKVRIDNHKRFIKKVNLLPKYTKLSIVEAIDELSQFPEGRYLKKLSNGGYRKRVGDYRIIFNFNAQTQEVLVYDVFHRKEAYR